MTTPILAIEDLHVEVEAVAEAPAARARETIPGSWSWFRVAKGLVQGSGSTNKAKQALRICLTAKGDEAILVPDAPP